MQANCNTNRPPSDQLVVDTLTQSELELLEQIAALEAALASAREDVAAYRLLTCAAIERLAALTIVNDRSRACVVALLDELREARAAGIERAA